MMSMERNLRKSRKATLIDNHKSLHNNRLSLISKQPLRMRKNKAIMRMMITKISSSISINRFTKVFKCLTMKKISMKVMNLFMCLSRL